MHMHKICNLNVWKKYPFASTKCRKILHLQNVARYGGFRNSKGGGNLKKGEVNFERGGSDPLVNYELLGLLGTTNDFIHSWWISI